ncbi:MAG: surA [Pedosphaera sp.]|nr:surA [Pedosphaera sp.]
MRTRLILSVGIALAAGAMNLRADIADSILAVVNDTPITQQQVEHEIGDGVEVLRNKYENQPDIFVKRLMDLREQGSEALIVREVILQDFKQNIKIPESILEEVVQDEIKRRFNGNNVELTKRLEAEGITREQYKKTIKERFIVSAMRDKFVPEPIISPKKVENFYMAHRSDFKLEDQIRMRMIVLNKKSGDTADQTEQTRKRAGEILLQLKGGAAFAELARSYSEGSTARDGGDTGWEDSSVVNKVLLEDVNKLKPGEYSGVVEATDAFYLLLLEDRHPAHYKPLGEVREVIERTLAAQETDRLAKQWVDRLKAKTFVNRR